MTDCTIAVDVNALAEPLDPAATVQPDSLLNTDRPALSALENRDRGVAGQASPEVLGPQHVTAAARGVEHYRKEIEKPLDSLMEKRGHRADAHQPGLVELFARCVETVEATITRLKLAAQPPDLLITIPRNACAFYEFHRAEELIDFLEDSPLVAHNATFDFGFLNNELQLCGRPVVCLSRMVDTLVLARTRHPGAKHSLDALCTRFGVDRSLRIKHGALLDAQLLAQVYVELTGGRQIGLGLVADTDPAEISVSGRPVTVREPRVPRPHFASAEELERHRAFIAMMASPLWERFAPAA